MLILTLWALLLQFGPTIAQNPSLSSDDQGALNIRRMCSVLGLGIGTEKIGFINVIARCKENEFMLTYSENSVHAQSPKIQYLLCKVAYQPINQSTNQGPISVERIIYIPNSQGDGYVETLDGYLFSPTLLVGIELTPLDAQKKPVGKAVYSIRFRSEIPHDQKNSDHAHVPPIVPGS
jgi:hypothetical protein